MEAEIDSALAVWEALKPQVETLINQKTAACLRSKKMNISTAPSNGIIGVSEAYGTEIKIPHSTALSGAAIGSSVRVVWMDNDFSTAVALWPGSVV
ncbi:MAG: hypothetical protein RR394_07810 [Oscillospiraceae bacterium]